MASMKSQEGAAKMIPGVDGEYLEVNPRYCVELGYACLIQAHMEPGDHIVNGLRSRYQHAN